MNTAKRATKEKWDEIRRETADYGPPAPKAPKSNVIQGPWGINKMGGKTK